jgi:hypothetical protein
VTRDESIVGPEDTFCKLASSPNKHQFADLSNFLSTSFSRVSRQVCKTPTITKIQPISVHTHPKMSPSATSNPSSEEHSINSPPRFQVPSLTKRNPTPPVIHLSPWKCVIQRPSELHLRKRCEPLQIQTIPFYRRLSSCSCVFRGILTRPAYGKPNLSSLLLVCAPSFVLIPHQPKTPRSQPSSNFSRVHRWYQRAPCPITSRPRRRTWIWGEHLLCGLSAILLGRWGCVITECPGAKGGVAAQAKGASCVFGDRGKDWLGCCCVEECTTCVDTDISLRESAVDIRASSTSFHV